MRIFSPVILYVSIFSLVGLYSCTTDSQRTSTLYTIPQKDTLLFTSKAFNLSLPSCKEDSNNCATVSIRWVEVQKPNVNTRTNLSNKRVIPFINSAVHKAILENLRWDVTNFQDNDSASMESLAKAFLNDYLRDRSEANNTDPIPWNCSIEVSVEHNTQHFIALRSSSYIYTGGAHPLQTTNYYVIATHNPRFLTLQDMVKDTANLRTIVEMELRRMYDIPIYHDLRNHGFMLSENSLPLTPNFAFTRNGLTLVYNPYDISPYSMGMHTIQLPYQALAGLLRRDIAQSVR